jgi:hypothetical protein
MRNFTFFSGLLVTSTILICLTAFADIPWDDSDVRQALMTKKNVLLGAGSFTGGDGALEDFRVTGLRAGRSPEGYDRFVIDLIGNEKGSASPLNRAPRFHVENIPATKKVVITLFGRPKLETSIASGQSSIRKTKFIQDMQAYPVLDDGTWTLALKTTEPVRTEVFELSQPSRIIIDLKK